MKLSPLKKKNHKKAARIFWLLFPFLGFWMLWRIFKFAIRFGHFYEIKHKKTILGLVAFTSLFFLNRKYFFIRYLSIVPKGRGKGIGSAVLRRLEKKAVAQKHHSIFLFSAPWRTKAHRFYKRNGFRRILGVLFWKKLK